MSETETPPPVSVRRLDAIRERDAQTGVSSTGLRRENRQTMSQSDVDRRWLLARVEELETAVKEVSPGHYGLHAHQHDPAVGRFHGCCNACPSGTPSPCVVERALAALNEVAP